MNRLNLAYVAIFVVLLIWIGFFESQKVERIQRGALAIFSPFIKASGRVSNTASTLEGRQMTYSQLEEAYIASRRERDQLRIEMLQLEEVTSENDELRKALDYKARSPLNLLPTRVVNRKPLTWYNTVVINKGSADGVAADLPVIAPVGKDGAGLVGKVTEVLSANSSVVLLLTDEMCQVPAVMEESEDQGIVSGERTLVRHSPTLRLRYLAKEADLESGDLVVSSGVGEVFGKNLLLGKVREFKRGVIDTEAILVPVVDFENLEDVFIMLPNAAGSASSSDQASVNVSSSVGG